MTDSLLGLECTRAAFSKIEFYGAIRAGLAATCALT